MKSRKVVITVANGPAIPPASACVIYARYSSLGQREASIEQQVDVCTAYAARHGLTVLRVYSDKHISGKTDDRPAFREMVADSAGRKWQTVLIYKTDRFARNRYDSAVYKYRLKKNGARVVCAMESIPDGPEGILMESVLEGSAEYYSANLSQNVRRGLMDNARKGLLNGSVPYGYRRGDNGEPIIVEERAEIVREIFRRYGNREGLRNITRDLNARNVPAIRGGLWYDNTVRSLVKHDVYIGVYHYGGVRLENVFPPIVDRATWDAAQLVLNRPRACGVTSRRGAREYLLTGRAVCGLCGNALTGGGNLAKGRYPLYYYICRGRRLAEGAHCTLEYSRADYLEDTVAAATVRYVLAPDVIQWIADRVMAVQGQVAESEELTALRAELAETENARGNILRAIEAGIFTPSTRARLEELEARAEELRRALSDKERESPMVEREFIVYWLSGFAANGGAGAGPEAAAARASLIACLVRSVTVWPDRLVICYNYAGVDGSVTLEPAGAPVPDSETLPGSTLTNGDATLYFVGAVLALAIPYNAKSRPGLSPSRNE